MRACVLTLQRVQPDVCEPHWSNADEHLLTALTNCLLQLKSCRPLPHFLLFPFLSVSFFMSFYSSPPLSSPFPPLIKGFAVFSLATARGLRQGINTCAHTSGSQHLHSRRRWRSQNEKKWRGREVGNGGGGWRGADSFKFCGNMNGKRGHWNEFGDITQFVFGSVSSFDSCLLAFPFYPRSLLKPGRH